MSLTRGFGSFGDNCIKPVAKQVQTPSYIECADPRVVLVYREVVPEKVKSPVEEVGKNDSLDLTGNPLEVDLNAGDCSFNVSIRALPDLWMPDEAGYGSLSLKSIRKSINSELATREWDDCWIYGLCDGKDKEKIVLLGAKQTKSTLCRVQAFIKKSIPADENSEDHLNNMKEEHFQCAKTMGNKLEYKIAHSIRASYPIYGYAILPNDNLLDCKYASSLFCDVAWSSFQYDIPKCVDSIDLTCQVIVGHGSSKLNPFWEELVLVRNHIQTFMKYGNGLKKATLTFSLKDSIEIVDSYESAFRGFESEKPRTASLEDANFDFQNLRKKTFTDKLWDLLKECATTSDLIYCFNYLFEDIAETKLLLNLREFPSYDRSFISNLLIQISRKAAAVPSFSDAQALTCLIELGIEKLKKDYFHILNNVECLDDSEAIQFWELSHPKVPNSARKTTNDRFRSTIHPSQVILPATELLDNYKTLLSLHIACDILVLGLRLPSLPTNLLTKVKRMLMNRQIKLAKPLVPLFELQVKLDTDVLEHINLSNPFIWNIKFSSENKMDIVETIFRHSAQKPFPPIVFDDYDDLSDNSGVNYYVTKSVSYVKKLIV